MALVNRYNTLCAQTVCSLLQALSGKHVVASLSCHHCLVGLCSLVLSQAGHWGLRDLSLRHPVARVGVRVSKLGRDGVPLCSPCRRTLVLTVVSVVEW